MRVLIIADEESRALYDHYDSSRLRDVDLILSCGDLSASYLEFLVTMGHAPVAYIMGNHDDRFRTHPPEGCICVEERVFNYKGLRIAGLGEACGTSRTAFTCTRRRSRKRESRS